MARVAPALLWVPMAAGSEGAREVEWPGELSGMARLPNGTFVLVDDETPRSVFIWDGDPARAPRRQALAVAFDDLEGAAADSAGHIYLLTSHSLTRRGHARRNREQIARCTPAAGSMARAGEQARPSAVEPDAVWSSIDVVGDLSGVFLDLLDCGRSELNLEGIAWYPPGDRLLIGARSPLRGTKAQVVALGPVNRIFDAARPPGSVSGLDHEVYTLDLGGRGIRSLAYDPWRRAVWVVGGGTHLGRPEYVLFLWSPERGIVEEVAAPGLARLAQPEGIEVMGKPDPDSGKTTLVVASEGARPSRLEARPKGTR